MISPSGHYNVLRAERAFHFHQIFKILPPITQDTFQKFTGFPQWIQDINSTWPTINDLKIKRHIYNELMDNEINAPKCKNSQIKHICNVQKSIVLPGKHMHNA